MVFADLYQQVDSMADDPGFGGTPHHQSEPDVFEIFQALLNDYCGHDDYGNSHESPNAGSTELYPDVYSDPHEICVMNFDCDDPTSTSFEKACVDSGAQKTVIRIPQASYYCSLFNV